MKKIIITSIAVTLGMIVSVVPALAATTSTTASLTPATIKVATGQQFNVVIAVDPNGTSNYAEKLEIDYPANLLEVTAFNIGSNWMALSQPGYDSTDNVNGILIKTAGYAGGLTSLTPFGTITFTAKASGSGAITIGSGSQAFESGSQTAITGTGSSIVVKTATIIPKHPASATAESTSTDLTPVSSINGQVLAASTTQSAIAAAAVSQVAAAAVGAGSGTPWMNILVWVVGIFIIGYIVYAIVKRNKSRGV